MSSRIEEIEDFKLSLTAITKNRQAAAVRMTPPSISSNTGIFSQFFDWWLRLRDLQMAGLFSGFL